MEDIEKQSLIIKEENIFSYFEKLLISITFIIILLVLIFFLYFFWKRNEN